MESKILELGLLPDVIENMTEAEINAFRVRDPVAFIQVSLELQALDDFILYRISGRKPH